MPLLESQWLIFDGQQGCCKDEEYDLQVPQYTSQTNIVEDISKRS